MLYREIQLLDKYKHDPNHHHIQEQPKPKSKKPVQAKKLISNVNAFERQLMYFLLVNTIQIVSNLKTKILTVFNMTSVINIEAQDSLLTFEAATIIHPDTPNGSSIYYFVFWLIMVHVLRIFTSIVGISFFGHQGYFCVYQKSGRLLSIFMLLSAACVLCRGIVTFLILVNYHQIKTVCEYEYTASEASHMAMQYTVLLVIFLVIEILVGLIGFLQATQARSSFKNMRQDELSLREKDYIRYEMALHVYAK